MLTQDEIAEVVEPRGHPDTADKSTDIWGQV